MRDGLDRLICPDCVRPIGAETGLEEIHNLIAHVAEHHNETLTMEEALERRLEWERHEPVGPLTWRCHLCGDERPDALIAVYSEGKLVRGIPVTVNVRYCADREKCRLGAPQVAATWLGKLAG